MGGSGPQVQDQGYDISQGSGPGLWRGWGWGQGALSQGRPCQLGWPVLCVHLKTSPDPLALQTTRIGVAVNGVRKHCSDKEVVSLAKVLIKNWKRLLGERGQGRPWPCISPIAWVGTMPG